MKKFIFLFVSFGTFFSCEKPHQYPRFIPNGDVGEIISVNTKKMANARRHDFDSLESFEDSLSTKLVTIPHDSIPAKPNLKIIIDTSYAFYAKGFEYDRIDFPFKEGDAFDELNHPAAKRWLELMVSLPKKYVGAFPVLIRNDSNSDALITNWKFIEEALDTDGKWKPISFWHYVESCLINSEKNAFIIYPQRYFGLVAVKYQGNFKTKVRIKFRVNNEYVFYSEPVSGSINREQFDTGFVKTYYRFNPNFGPEELEDFKAFIFLDK